MQIGELALERYQRMVGSGDVPRPASAYSHANCAPPWRRSPWGVGPCRDSRWSTRSRSPAAVGRMPERSGKLPGDPFDLCEDTIAVFVSKPRQGIREVVIIVHRP